MKSVKLLIAIAVMAMLGGIAMAETGRLGSGKYTFSPTREVTKVAAYTTTTNDSLVSVNSLTTATTITLHSVSDAMYGQRQEMKIIKTDSSTNKVTVTAATGDTIGGEASRIITYQNAYIVIHAGPGRDWSIDYESPYVIENHLTGIVTIGSTTF